jgi:hypothetical protein
MPKRKPQQTRRNIARRQAGRQSAQSIGTSSAASAGKQAKAGSKQAQVLAMLESPAGASIAAIMEATGWQQHSARGFLAAVVRKKLQRELTSTVVDGVRVYRIAGTGHAPSASARPRRHKA